MMKRGEEEKMVHGGREGRGEEKEEEKEEK